MKSAAQSPSPRCKTCGPPRRSGGGGGGEVSEVGPSPGGGGGGATGPGKNRPFSSISPMKIHSLVRFIVSTSAFSPKTHGGDMVNSSHFAYEKKNKNRMNLTILPVILSCWKGKLDASYTHCMMFHLSFTSRWSSPWKFWKTPAWEVAHRPRQSASKQGLSGAFVVVGSKKY